MSSLHVAVQAGGPKPTEGSSSHESRQDAVQRVPLRLLNEQARQKLAPVLDSPSIFRRMPTQAIECDPEMFNFLVRHPEVLVNVWDLMGITNVTVDRLSPFVFRGKDGAGTQCQAELIYGTDELHIYYGNGSYDGTMTGRELNGRCVCILHGKPVQKPNGETTISGQMDVFLKLDNMGADLLAKTLGPFVGKTADYNFTETAKFVAQLSQIAQRNPNAMQQLASRLDHVQPSVRDQFVVAAQHVSERSSHLIATPSLDSVSSLHGDAILQQWKEQSKVPPRELQLRTPEKTDVIMRR